MDAKVLLALLAIIPIVACIYVKYWEKVFSLWKVRGIKELPGTFPYGSSESFTLQTEFQGDIIKNMCDQFPNDTYFGFYQGSIPFLVIRDPEMIRLVLAKEFSHFRDRSGHKIKTTDHLAQHLFHLEGDKWRGLRLKMSPVFTSGKLKDMFPLFTKCAEILDNLLMSQVDSTIDVKSIAEGFIADVICTCVFGLDVARIEKGENPFIAMGKMFNKPQFGFVRRFRLFMKRYFPFISALSTPRITPKEVENFMLEFVKCTIEQREKTEKAGNDFIDLLMQIKNKGILNEEVSWEDTHEKNVEPIEMTIELMAAQCYIFFIAGFETSSSVKSFCLYQLAFHPEIQERLHREIEMVIKKHGDLTYQAVHEMSYLDMVINETMRKHPTVAMLNRRCTITFTTPYGHTIEKGDRIIIPIWALHHDPEIFPEPDKFDPERFSEKNKPFIHQFAFLPFGEGPRMCIGERFGRLQTKMGIITVLRRYVVSPCAETIKKLDYNPKMPILRTKFPIILKLSKRDLVL